MSQWIVVVLAFGLQACAEDVPTGQLAWAAPEVKPEGPTMVAVPTVYPLAVGPFNPAECPEFHQVPSDLFVSGTSWMPVVLPMKAAESCECWKVRARERGWDATCDY